MNQIPRCDWVPKRARWSYTARSGFLAWSRKIKDHYFGVLPHVINPLLTKCEVKMAGYRPSPFLRVLHKHAEKVRRRDRGVLRKRRGY